MTEAHSGPGAEMHDPGAQQPRHLAAWARAQVAALRGSRNARVSLVAASLLGALAIDWLLAPTSYPVGAAYGIALLLAAQLLSPRSVALVTACAVGLSVASNVQQGAPTMAAAADNSGLLAIGVLAFLLARQRQITEAARDRLELQYSAVRALAESRTLEAAGSQMLSAIGQHLGWARGALWCIDTDGSVLTCAATWLAQGPRPDSFDEQTHSTQFTRGSGLPGRVWAEGHPVWISNVQKAPNYPRRQLADEAGLNAAMAFPVLNGDEFLGVIEFYNSGVLEPDASVLALMEAVGAQLGLSLARIRADNQLSLLLERERSARERAEAGVRLRDRFLASVSHDLRNPLSAILGNAQLARLRSGRLPEAQREPLQQPLDNIVGSVRHMAAALDELLDLAQLQAGERLALRPEPTDLVALARRGAANQCAASETSHIEVVTETPELIGWWDVARLERVLGNLLSNAVKYSPDHTSIRVSLARRQTDGQEWAVLRVEDHGIGIPEADLAHVFEAFRRAGNAAKVSAGTGLGLAGSREILLQHGGSISVQSREGFGSTFIVELPLGMDNSVAHR
jgi:signal transduction histidine kinase